MKQLWIRLWYAWKLWRMEKIMVRAYAARTTLTGTLPEPAGHDDSI